MRLPRFWVLAAAQVALVLAGACVWFYFETRALLAAPPPTADAYALSWSVQIMIFLALGLPLLLLAAGLLLGAEYLTRWLYYKYQRGGVAKVEPDPPPQ